jgi:hypothetical protein
MTTQDGTVGRYLGWFLVVLSLGAGVIHFAVSGGHFDMSWWHGAFFAVVAWLQLCWAAAMVLRPTRTLLGLGVVGNTAVMLTWAVSRIWGVPIGPEAWEAESVSMADGLATGFEAAIVLVALAVLLQPRLTQRTIRPRLGLAGIGTTTLAIAVVSTVALSPSFASDHHGSGGHSSDEEAAADHAHDDENAAHADLAADGGHAEGHTDYAIVADGTSACERAGYANEGNSGHGHRGPVPHVPMDEATRAEFQEQVRQAEAAVARHPTVADAEAAGYRGITPYVPCIAAHYINSGLVADGFNPSEPEILLYTGTDPDSEIVGLSYLQLSDEEPEGFAGEIDPWHVHESLCLGGGVVRGDETTTDEECEARGGTNVELGNLWMNHMWPVVGWESRWGLFSSEHPDLGGDFGNLQTE